MNTSTRISPPLQASQWLNSPKPVTLEGLHGQVVVLYAFQMLCPGCVSHGLPQALNIHRLFPKDRVAVIGLHTVFEHHEVMGPQALRVFLNEYRIPFPVGIDRPDPGSPIPLTMRAFALRGTPSILVFDQTGHVRLRHFGQIDDLQLGALIGQLLAEAPSATKSDVSSTVADRSDTTACAYGACSVGA